MKLKGVKLCMAISIGNDRETARRSLPMRKHAAQLANGLGLRMAVDRVLSIRSVPLLDETLR
jgi:hypothetical protein